MSEAQKFPTQPAIRFTTMFPRKRGKRKNGGKWGEWGKLGGDGEKTLEKWGKMQGTHIQLM